MPVNKGKADIDGPPFAGQSAAEFLIICSRRIRIIDLQMGEDKIFVQYLCERINKIVAPVRLHAIFLCKDLQFSGHGYIIRKLAR